MANNKDMTAYCFEHAGEKTFGDLGKRAHFMCGGILWVKIFENDLKEFGISQVNALAVISGGISHFDADESVIEVKFRKKIKKSAD